MPETARARTQFLGSANDSAQLSKRIREELGTDGFTPSLSQIAHIRDHLVSVVTDAFELKVGQESTLDSPLLCIGNTYCPTYLEKEKERGFLHDYGCEVSWDLDVSDFVVQFVTKTRELVTEGRDLEESAQVALIHIARDAADSHLTSLSPTGEGRWMTFKDAIDELRARVPIEEKDFSGRISVLKNFGKVSSDCQNALCEDSLSEMRRVHLVDHSARMHQTIEIFSLARAKSLAESSTTPTRDLYKMARDQGDLATPEFTQQLAISTVYESIASRRNWGLPEAESVTEQIQLACERSEELIKEHTKRFESVKDSAAQVRANQRDYVAYATAMRDAVVQHKPFLLEYFNS